MWSAACDVDPSSGNKALMFHLAGIGFTASVIRHREYDFVLKHQSNLASILSNSDTTKT
jgi:hypothetical protein